ncbi:sensor histidine kinase [Portibacter marinus]|uniref:sensor histidine kinase n=1 Tax=Portibacter marinus TaxID=2898660 RepID=UPI001F3844DA|nr:histidine kinase [Portibacter marinus]
MNFDTKWTFNFKNVITATAILAAMVILLITPSQDVKILMRLVIGGLLGYHLLLYLFTKGILNYQNQHSISRILMYVASIFTLIAGINHFSQYENAHHNDGFFVVNGNAWIVDFFGILLAGLLFYILFSSVYLLWERKKKTENESVKAELLTLKNQINPHFYFNTLNNLYALIKSDQVQAQRFVLKLSDLMRYTIYKGGQKFVTLEEEMEYLSNYIELQTSRFRRDVHVNFQTEIENTSTKISPLLFIILLENAFKHGVEKLIDGGVVDIKLKETDGQVDFQISNNYDGNGKNKMKGIGLKNLKDSLNLLYPNRHILKLDQFDNQYIAKLRIST